MKKLIMVCAVAIAVLTAVPAQAVITFDFEGATPGGNTKTEADQRVSTYMTAVYGSSVTATDGWVMNNTLSGVDWLGNTGQWLRTCAWGGAVPWDFEISFDTVPITKVSSDFYVFIGAGTDFTLTAYNSAYGDRENPNAGAMVGLPHIFNPGVGPSTFSISFGSPVSLLVFSDGGYDDVAIDNLNVSPVPVPGAILLAGIGAGLVGWLRRRKSL